MIYKYSIKNLIKEGVIKKCPLDWKMIRNLINRAYKDMKTAERNLDEDEECTYNYAYNSMLRCGMALMFSEGYRPDIKDKHLTTVKFASSILGGKYKKITNDFDIMRRKRHHFIYEPDIPC